MWAVPQKWVCTGVQPDPAAPAGPCLLCGTALGLQVLVGVGCAEPCVLTGLHEVQRAAVPKETSLEFCRHHSGCARLCCLGLCTERFVLLTIRLQVTFPKAERSWLYLFAPLCPFLPPVAQRAALPRCSRHLGCHVHLWWDGGQQHPQRGDVQIPGELHSSSILCLPPAQLCSEAPACAAPTVPLRFRLMEQKLRAAGWAASGYG